MRDDPRANGLQTVRLGELGSFRRGQGGTKADERPDGAPCVRYGDLYTEHDAVIRGFSKFIARESISRYTPLLCGDVVLAASGETHDEIGKGAVYCGKDVAYAGGDTIIFRPGNAVHPLFIGYAVNARDAELFKARYGQGSSVIHISAAHLGELPLVLLPLPEQRHIAEILDTLDEAIRKTEQVIGKLQQMKQGLLHDLLTRGIDDNGELRDPEHHPEQFKRSPLGRIPREWVAGTLGTVAVWQSGGTPPKSVAGYWEGDIPWVSPKDMKLFRISDTVHRTTAAGVAAGSRTVPSGTVLIVVRGMILAHTFPVCLTVRTVAFNQDVKAVVPTEQVDGTFLAHWFVGNSGRMLGMVTEATHGTKRIDLADLESCRIGLPPLAEQRRIAKVLDAQDTRLVGEREKADKLRTLKHGLMDDLLTGRVRVSVPEEAAA